LNLNLGGIGMRLGDTFEGVWNNKGNNHTTINMATKQASVDLHIFANKEVFNGLERKVIDMAYNNAQIPRIRHLSYTPDAHVGVGTCIGTTAVWQADNGMISPSIVGSDIGCGMRVIKTQLHKDDIADKRVKRQLIEAIETYVNTTDESNFRKTRKPVVGYYSDMLNLEDILKNGISGLPTAFLSEDSYNVENHEFRYDWKYLDSVPQKGWKYAKSQIGTLGGGNHFIEIQALEIQDSDTATKWGLFDGQVVIMIHTGSRAWGGRIGVDATREIKAAMEMWGVTNPDPNLAYAPYKSDEGRKYYNLMLSALNYAVVNRHMVGYGVTQAFKDVFGQGFQTKVLYDLMHNYALLEPHRNKIQLVHRKGATRALPAGHFLNPQVYKETGHPALIPGSMGTSSYIMVGREEGAKNFYSICHGAGRVRSRRATREAVTIDEFAQSLRVGTDDEILVNQRTLEDIIDESPQAYKDVDQIIDSVVGAKLADVVAKCKPLAVIKGC
jgi:tRNA-splicing ligase RtcB (3'-phosphate/5'-hydroxy nucleic acid ligase)